MAVTNLAEISAIAVHQTRWQTPGFSDPRYMQNAVASLRYEDRVN